MKVVIAPDGFKESLPAPQVAQAMARGVVDAAGDAVVDLCPMADGGGGTVAAMVAATRGRTVSADVFDPMGGSIRAHFGLLGRPDSPGLPGELGLVAAEGVVDGEFDGQDEAAAAGGTAVIEMAAASGLALVPQPMRNPLRATTFGTGQLLLAALDLGVSEIIIGIGGSATTDGGCGCAQAMGVAFLDGAGAALAPGIGGGSLGEITRISMAGRDVRIAGTRIRVACDVTNPLTGPDGAACVYGPQKGATPEMVKLLDEGLKRLAHVIRRDIGIDVENMAGAGAAGGLGGGLAAFAGATIQRGVELVAQAVRLARRLKGADLCITGEGKLDRSSSFGKTAIGVADIAAGLGVPVICIPGQAAADGPRERFAAVLPLVGPDVTVRQAMADPESILRTRAGAAVREFLTRK
ncbi:MAG: glycerate kinase [Planctomycetes bacterium]|nr:glycerate kinase [Planctomycetota bacterium]